MRAWALEEANRLDEPEKIFLREKIDRSFTEEAGRRRFWRFFAFGSSALTVTYGVHFLEFLPIVSALGGLLWITLWPLLWYLMDRYAKHAFELPEDGRILWRKHEEARKRAVADAASTEADLADPTTISQVAPAPAWPAQGHETLPVERFVDRLAGGQAGRGEVEEPSNTELVMAAQRMLARYAQCLREENRRRAGTSNVAFWVLVVSYFGNPALYPAALVLGLYALYYRSSEATRILDDLITVLEVLRTERGIPISVQRLIPNPDPRLLTRMRRQRPALQRLLADEPPPEEPRVTLSDQEQAILRELSAEVLLAPYQNIEDTLAALKRLETIGDASVLPAVQNLARSSPRFTLRTPLQPMADYREDARRIQQAARSCLEALNARLEVQDRTLLRPAHSPKMPEVLLRPVEARPDEHRPEELLRANNVAPEPAYVSVVRPQYGVEEEPGHAEVQIIPGRG